MLPVGKQKLKENNDDIYSNCLKNAKKTRTREINNLQIDYIKTLLIEKFDVNEEILNILISAVEDNIKMEYTIK